MDLIKGKNLTKADGSSHSADAALAGKDVILVYFSAHWCPPCRAFTPVLKDFYEEVESEGVEIIFVSSDRSPADMVSYMKESHGDWLAVEHGSELGQGEINNYVSTYFNIIYFPEDFKLKDSLNLCFAL